MNKHPRKERTFIMMKKEKITAEIDKAVAKRDELNAKIEDLEEKYRQAEDAEILELVHAAALTPEGLAQVMANAKNRAQGKKAKEE